MSMQGKQQLGSYIITRQLGKGGFATVYLGRHIHLGTLAAIKILNGEYAQEQELEAFRQEARTIADLKHRHIVRVLDFGVEEGIAFLVLEFAPFGSLRTQYGSNVLPLEAIASYVQQVASALQYAHRYNIIHRDVKPENMLIDAEQKILLSDFGMAQLITSSMRTNSGPIGGTAAYISPEQLQGKPGKASDQYALAVTVYEWLTGSWPFQGQPLEVISQHLNTTPPPLRSFVPDIPLEIEDVVLRGLEKDPALRFPTVVAFARALHQAAGIEPRPAAEEQFRPLLHKRTTMEQRSKKTREFASVKTIRQVQPSSQGTTGSTGLLSPLIPRRTILIGGLTALAVGIGGIVVVGLQRGGPTEKTGSGSALSPTATATQASKPTTAVTQTPKSPTATPKPNPTTAPTAAPTQTPPTPTPIPTPPPGTLIFSIPTTATMFSAAWSPDGTKIAAGGADNMVHIWDAATGTQLISYPYTQAVTYVAWSPDSRKIASACNDGSCHVWDLAGNSIIVYTGGAGNIHSVAWSPDGTKLASGGNDKVVKVWDMTGNTLATYAGHTTFVWGIAWSPDGTRIASGSGDGKANPPENTVKVWQWQASNTLAAYNGHTSVVYYVAWSPDGKRIASGSDDTTVQVWDAKTGRNIQTYYNHTDTVYGVAWSPDGTRLASGSTDNTVVIWSMIQGVGAYTYTGHSGYVFGVTWSPDGTKIASSSADNTIQIWQA